MSAPDDLHEKINEAAKSLLSRVLVGDKLREQNADAETMQSEANLVAEQVKAFQSVVNWAGVRHKIDPPPPPEKKESQADVLRRRFDGAKALNRRVAPKVGPDRPLDIPDDDGDGDDPPGAGPESRGAFDA